MKKIIWLMALLLCLTLATVKADYADIGTILSPPSQNFTYNLTVNLTFTTLEVNNTCIVITGGNFPGTYCYNVTFLELSETILFPGSPVVCLGEWDNHNGSLFFIEYNWLDAANNSLESGNIFCEDEVLCAIDTLSGSDVTAGDTIGCKVNYTDGGWFLWEGWTNDIDVSSIGECSATNQYELLNITYYDELETVNINVTNRYNVSFYTGDANINTEGTWEGNYSDIFCTSVDPAIEVITLTFFGELTLTKQNYVTRVFEIPLAGGIVVSNNPSSQENLTLIKVENSTTISYTWQTEEFQFINGNMLIYRCDVNGSKTLIESVLISNGAAEANLNLLTTPYSYEIVVDGELFTDDSFTLCHTESTTERSFVVDITALNVLPVVGLVFVQCDLTKTANHTVKLTWGSNSEDPGDIEACIVASTSILGNKNEFYRDCSNGTDGTMTRAIPDPGVNYWVDGELQQDGNIGYCGDTLSFFNESLTSLVLGIGAAFGIALLLMAVVLVFTGQGSIEVGLAAMAVVMIVVWLLGLVSLPWEIVFMIVIFLFMIIFINRHTKKRVVE